MHRARRRRTALLLALPVLLAAAGFLALGLWQVERRAWKHALIATTEARAHAAPIPAPPLDSAAAAEAEAYRRVAATGRFDLPAQVTVQANTVRGPGFWVLTPLLRDGQPPILINRGFIPRELREDYATAERDERPRNIVGLLRPSEPGGRALRHNDAASGRWFSRDVAAIAAARGVDAPLPYFIDLQEDSLRPPAAEYPVPGLTVLQFTDNHAVYALTWFALAAMCLGAGAWLVRDGWRPPAP